MPRFAIQVVWADGESELVAGPDGTDAIFSSRESAEEVAEGFRMGMDGDVQSVSVVRSARPAGKGGAG